jgi:GR25 family glycosyltransferase involved in LPS biosynthesis
MDVLTDYFGVSFFINLDSRPDKCDQTCHEIVKHRLGVMRYPAVDGGSVEYYGDLKPGVVGCFLSHKAIISLARENGIESVLILEDDVAFDDDLNEKFREWYKEVPDNWDMLYLGGNHNVKRIIGKISEHVLRVTQTQTTHAYAVKNTVYDLILDRLETLDKDVDVAYTDVQKQCNAFCFTPRLAWQRPGLSDIWQQHVDYDFLRDNDGCHKGTE